MQFPLTEPDESAIKVMYKTWERVDLERYLQRWELDTIEARPAALDEFSWRGLDIGCGFGRYIIEIAQQHPECGYLGIDKGTLRGGNMKKRVEAAGVENLFGIHGNVTPVLVGFPDAYFDEITIFYPNPWWPSKHRKKRWAYHPILNKIIDVLKPGGRILLTSNEAFYLAEWQYCLQHHPHAKDLMTLDYSGPIQQTVGRTHFEAKFLAEGTPCGEVRFVKKA